jgi:hypothetical protein
MIAKFGIEAAIRNPGKFSPSKQDIGNIDLREGVLRNP